MVFFDLILTLIRLLSHAELLEGFLSLVDLTWGPHAFTVQPVVCSVYFYFYFILTLIWLVSHAELLDICFFSQKTFEGIKTETWVRLGNYLEEYAVSGENKITEMIGFLVRVGVLS